MASARERAEGAKSASSGSGGGGGSSSSSSSRGGGSSKQPAVPQEEEDKKMLKSTTLIVSVGTNIHEGQAHKTTAAGPRGEITELAGQHTCAMTHAQLLNLLKKERYPDKWEPHAFSHSHAGNSFAVVGVGRGQADFALAAAPWNRMLLARAEKADGNAVHVTIVAKYDSPLPSSVTRQPRRAAAASPAPPSVELSQVTIKCLSKPSAIMHVSFGCRFIYLLFIWYSLVTCACAPDCDSETRAR